MSISPRICGVFDVEYTLASSAMHFELKQILAVVATYFVGVSACYLFGYWGAFNVNIFEYVGLSDIAKLSIYPLLVSFAFVLSGFLVSELLVSPALPPGGGNDTAIGRFGLKHARGLLSGMVVLGVLVAIFGQEPWRWFSVALFVGAFSVPLQHNDWIIRTIPHPRVRATLLSLALLLPSMSFAYGRFDAYLVKTGNPTNVVDIARSKLSLSDDQKHPVSLLGFVGGTYILFESRSGEVVYAKQSDSAPLYVTPKDR